MNQPCGRGGFASDRGGFNPSTSGINQERREVSIFQRFLGNRDGSAQSNDNPRGFGRGGRGGYRGGRGGGFKINDDRPQHLREQALAEFRSHKVPVLCATDVLERGIDINELDHVINMDLPISAITYIHRIGRTGRITQGYATTFFAGSEPLLYEIAKMLREDNEGVPETLQAAITAIAD